MAYTKIDRDQIPHVERRIVPAVLEIRMDEKKENKTLFGYTAKFNEKTLLYQWSDEEWYERIAPEAFNECLENDVRCLKNHDANFVLGRNKAGTLNLKTDETGLFFECTPDMKISYAADTVHSVNRGDISQCSFAFTIEKQSWEEENKEGKTIVTRTIEKVKQLYDVGPVTYPAYENTDVGVRMDSVEEYREALKEYRVNSTQPQKEESQEPKVKTIKINVGQRRRALHIAELEND